MALRPWSRRTRSPTGEWDYVAGDDTRRLYGYTLVEDGAAGAGEPLGEADGADEFASDCHGKLYAMRAAGLAAFDAEERVFDELEVESNRCSETAGGMECSTMF